MERFKKIINGLGGWLKRRYKSYNEYIPLLLALPAWWFSGIVTHLIDPSASIDDAGLFQALIFGLVLYFAAQACAWFSMRIAFPVIGKFIDNYVQDIFSSLPNVTRIWVAVILFTVHFIGAVIIFSLVI